MIKHTVVSADREVFISIIVRRRVSRIKQI